jgi:hypothetical protein
MKQAHTTAMVPVLLVACASIDAGSAIIEAAKRVRSLHGYLMKDPNPYAPPKSHVADAVESPAVDFMRMNRVASGQRLLIAALIASLVAASIRTGVNPVAGLLFGLVAAVMSIVGVLRIDGGLQGSVLSRIFYVVAMLLPLINLIIMFTLNMRATKALRAAGYHVGFLGAKQRSHNVRGSERLEPTL